jgi:hypothetical protein
MIIRIEKFGRVLSGRPPGAEAFKAFTPTLNEAEANEPIIVDFEGVLSFSPSWGDEFLTPLRARFGDRIVLRNATNPSVRLTVDMLGEISGKPFRIKGVG